MPSAIDTSRYRVPASRRFRLDSCAPDDLPPRMTKEAAEKLLTHSRTQLRDLQERLYAQDEWSLLVILQGMDGSGKDSTIEHVFSGLNPQGCEVHSFKVPSDEELDHDFLWRTTLRLPRRGHIGIFNRSYYEEVVVIRVHPELLDAQRLPKQLATQKSIWDERFEDIVAHERHLARNGTVVRKIFLNISQDEQRERMLKRLEEPEKLWKFSAADLEERRLWGKYQDAYESLLQATSTDEAPWFVVPADRKWWARTVVAAVLVDALHGLDLRFPTVPPSEQTALGRIRKELEREQR